MSNLPLTDGPRRVGWFHDELTHIMVSLAIVVARLSPSPEYRAGYRDALADVAAALGLEVRP